MPVPMDTPQSSHRVARRPTVRAEAAATELMPMATPAISRVGQPLAATELWQQAPPDTTVAAPVAYLPEACPMATESRPTPAVQTAASGPMPATSTEILR